MCCHKEQLTAQSLGYVVTALTLAPCLARLQLGSIVLQGTKVSATIVCFHCCHLYFVAHNNAVKKLMEMWLKNEFGVGQCVVTGSN